MRNWLNKIKNKKCIHQRKNQIFVFENKRYRWLTFNENFIQSLMDKKNPKKLIIPYLNTLCLFHRENPGSTCLLGLGSGSLVHHLQHPHYPLTVVEHLSDVIDIARNYFFLPNIDAIQIKNMCAMNFFKTTSDMFKHIIIDLGNEEGFPPACKSNEFFQNIHAHLLPEGFLTLNLPSFSDLAFFKPLFKSIFGTHPLIISENGNWVLMASKKHTQTDLITMLQNKHILKSFIWHPHYGDLAILRSPFSQKIQGFIHQILAYVMISSN